MRPVAGIWLDTDRMEMGKEEKGICFELFGIETTLSFRWEEEREGGKGRRAGHAKICYLITTCTYDLFFAFLALGGRFWGSWGWLGMILD